VHAGTVLAESEYDMNREFLDEAERGYLNGLAKDAGTTSDALTRDDLSVSFNANSITVSAMVDGHRMKIQYIGWDEDDAVAEFLSAIREDAS
jgi:hypothetical protein